MIYPEKITKRLSLLQEYLHIIEKKTKIPKDVFLSNPDHYYTFERLLHLSSEAMLDIGNHIIAQLQLGKPEFYSDVFKILTDSKIINQDLGKNLQKFAGLRNILVHDYIDINREQLFEETKESIGNIKEFIRLISKIIRKE